MRAGFEQLVSGRQFEVIPAQLDLRADQPDLVVVEADTQTEATAAAIDHIKAMCPACAVVLLADAFDPGELVLLQGAGADGFCLTSMKPEVMIKVLELVTAGGTFVPAELLESLTKDGASHPETGDLETEEPAVVAHPLLCKLSRREAEILRMLVRGDANKLIAKKLDLADATVKVHVKAAMRKLGVANRTQAAMWANEHLIPVRLLTPSKAADSTSA
jgi:two-component system nitrate/nitrite response regulator NarL